jgi:molybdopterin converting factor subunit 1
MRIDVLLFAALREATGESRLELELDPGATVGDALAALAIRHPALSRGAPLVAVNREYAAKSRPLLDGDEVALIPPVSGG